jgi:hypothetical protein
MPDRCSAYYLLVALLAALIALPTQGATQTDSIQITKNFQFADGLYLSFTAFQRNQPDLTWEEVDAQVFTNPQTHEAKVAAIRLLGKDPEENTFLAWDKVWGISKDGIPYVRLEEPGEKEELVTFAALRLRGKICYFSYRAVEVRDIEVSAYNPQTGRPFRTGIIRREFPVTREKMLHFESGVIAEFTLENFLEWIEDDPGLKESVLELTDEEIQEKLFRCLLIYVDRHPVFTISG